MFIKPKGKMIEFNGQTYIRVSRKTRYRINLQPAIFKKDLLNRVLETEPLSAWDVELEFMSDRFSDIEAYFSLNKSFSFTNYIDKGLATRKAVRLLKKEHLWNNQRNIMPIHKTIEKKIVNRLRFLIPQKIKDKLKHNDKIYK